MKNEGLLKFYNNAALYSDYFAQLGRIRKCAESSRMNSTQKGVIRHFVDMKRGVIREHKVYKGDKA